MKSTGSWESNPGRQSVRLDLVEILSDFPHQFDTARAGVSQHIHIESPGHTVDLEGVRILDTEQDYFKRGIKEAIYIRALQPSLKRDGGRYRLHTTFDPLLTSHVEKITCPQHLGSANRTTPLALERLTKPAQSTLNEVPFWTLQIICHHMVPGTESMVINKASGEPAVVWFSRLSSTGSVSLASDIRQLADIISSNDQPDCILDQVSNLIKDKSWSRHSGVKKLHEAHDIFISEARKAQVQNMRASHGNTCEQWDVTIEAMKENVVNIVNTEKELYWTALATIGVILWHLLGHLNSFIPFPLFDLILPVILPVNFPNPSAVNLLCTGNRHINQLLSHCSAKQLLSPGRILPLLEE
ncbi:hypothetical protein Bbelb_071490 [Branchiostoma belcheri]|nr:hypothetical protein Bbelb_071490 [Branchiostoma belcheri]